jgi:hypothetical protein
MKGKIDSHGCLWIERNKNMKMMECPFNETRACGDACPLFRDWYMFSATITTLKICERKFQFTSFKDEREG